MGRTRQSNHSLPPRMHLKGGCYYYVTSTKPRKWIKLHTDLPKARLLWAQVENGDGSASGLFNHRMDSYLVSPQFMELSKGTQDQYHSVAKTLRAYFDGAQMGAITPAHVAMWLDNHHSKSQANIGKAIIGNVFNLAVRHGVVNLNPAKGIKYLNAAGRDRLITDDEYRAIWNKAELYVRVVMDIGYLTGSRIQDILDIKLADVTGDGVYIKQRKTGKKILFVASPALMEAINRARVLPRRVRGMSLLCNHFGRPYPYSAFNKAWIKAVLAAKVEDVHFHDIRAKAATDAKGLGMDYQALLGHTTQAMSDRYLRVREVQRVEVLPRMVSSVNSTKL